MLCSYDKAHEKTVEKLKKAIKVLKHPFSSKNIIFILSTWFYRVL